MEAGPSRYWEEADKRAASSVEAVRASLSSFPSGPLRVSRVAQLDAGLLDSELESILSAPVLKALEGARAGSGNGRDWNDELVALLRLAVLKLSLYDKRATYGSSLQNLKYRDERKHVDGLQSTAVDSSPSQSQKSAYIALHVLPPYLLARLRDRMATSSWADEPLPRSWLSLVDVRRLRRQTSKHELAQEWKRATWELVNISDRLWAMLDLVNFLVFLYDGKYRSLVDRLLKLRLIYASRSVSRNVSFEFLNRQLVWEAFTEFLLFLMPLVNLHRLRVRMTRMIMKRTSESKTLHAVVQVLPAPVARALRLPVHTNTNEGAAGKGKGKDDTSRGVLYFLPKDTCPVCYSTYTSPPSALPTTAIPSDPTSSTAALASLTHHPSTTGASSGPANEDTSIKIPYVANCGSGCRYCYYCITGRLVQADEAAEDSWDCLRCGRDVTAADREVDTALDNTVVGANDGDEDASADEKEGEGDEAGSVGSEHERWR